MGWSPSQDADGNFIINIGGVNDPLGLRARMVKAHFATIPFGTTKDIDWLIPQLSYLGVNKQSYFNGVEYAVENAELGDSIQFQFVDVDNILGYGAGFVVEEFADVYAMPSRATSVLYKAKLLPGLYVRVKYISTGTVDVKFVCNIFRHLNQNEDV